LSRIARSTCSTVAALLIAASLAGAQSTRPAIASGSAFDTQPIRRESQPPTTQAAATRDASLPAAAFDTTRVLVALAAVLGLIFLARLLMKKLFPSVAAGRAGTAVRVLSRAPLSPKQQVLLLQVGRRVLVVGDCGTQMNSLAEITDGEEIASLLVELESQKSSASAARFGSLFGRARESFEEPDQAPEEESPPLDLGLAGAHGEIQGLMDKVRGIAQKLKQP
jgi:flagellar biogenesis protein FliO